MGDGGASNTSPCIAEIRARSAIFNGYLHRPVATCETEATPGPDWPVWTRRPARACRQGVQHQQAYPHAGCERKKRISACGTGR